MPYKPLEKGCLVIFDVINKSSTPEDLASLSTFGLKKNEAMLYESIYLESYPSSRDFRGKTSIIRHGDTGIVLKHIGRPWKFNQSERWNIYEVYEVLLSNSEVRQVFRYNITKKKD